MSSCTIGNSPYYKQILVTDNILPFLEGIFFEWGGQSPDEGFDCSGLIIWLYNQIDIKHFRLGYSIVSDVTADELFIYNTLNVGNIGSISSGDLIFFDTDKDGIIEHVAVFDCIDDCDNVWVWDATRSPDGIEINIVSHRYIKSFWSKNPFLS